MIVVSNATPLIALAKINHLHLLQRFFVTVLIPQAVHEEVVAAGVGRPGSREVRQADWIQLRTVSDEIGWPICARSLTLPKLRCWSWVKKCRRIFCLSTNPRRAWRRVFLICAVWAPSVSFLAKRRGDIPAVRPLLDDLRAKKFRLSEKVYLSVVKEAGE